MNFQKWSSFLAHPVKIFGKKIAKRTSFSEVYSFSTWPNLCQCTTVLNADIPHCYIQRVLNAAARLVTGTRKFDRGLERLLHDDLHWLDIPERVQFKLGLTVRRCLRRRAPGGLLYVRRWRRQHLRSASRRQLVVPRHRLSMFGRRAFTLAGPMSWNSLPNSLRESACDDNISDNCFKHSLKTFLFSGYWRTERSRGVYDSALYKCTFTYLITYLLHNAVRNHYSAVHFMTT